MTRLLPSTLSGRLVLILLSGLLAAQFAGAAILLYDRARAVYERSGLHAAQRIASVVSLLDTLDAEQRRIILPAVNTHDFRVALERGAFGPVTDDAEGEIADRLRDALEDELGEHRALNVAVIAARTGFPASYRPGHPRHGAAAPPHRQFFGDDAPMTNAFVVEAQLRDGRWVGVAHQLPDAPFAWPKKILFALSVLLLSVILLSMIAVRWVTRPLAVLAQAADALGRDIERPPLPETGPQEIKRAAHAFNTMQSRLAAFIRERARMLAAVSHDLATPITRLRLRAESIGDEALRAKIAHDLDDMEEMTGATLEFLRDSNKRTPVAPVDINALLESLQADAEALGRQIQIDGVAVSPYSARPSALRRCLDNLIENAVKYGTRALVSVDDNRQRLQITVADEGPGIPPDKLEQVFEPFFRLETSRSRETGGVGLGLSIARDIARSHGGELILRNRSRGGLEAILSLPR